MREKRSDIFYETTGVLMEEGKKWHDIRSKGGHSKNVLKLLVLSVFQMICKPSISKQMQVKNPPRGHKIQQNMLFGARGHGTLLKVS